MSTEMELQPPIFIVGLPRTGNTLWARILANHPDVAAFGEMHFLTPWRRDFRYLLRQIGDLSNDANVQYLVQKLFAEEPVAGIARGNYFWKQIRSLQSKGLRQALETRLLQSNDRSIGLIFKSLIEEATRCRERRRAVVRLPVFPAYILELMQWWPDAKIIHISRDPCGLAASKTNDPGGIGRLKQIYPWLSPILPLAGKSFAIIQYIWTSRAHAKVSAQQNYRLYFYEDLVARPDSTVRDLCNFCNLEFAERMLHPEAGQASSTTGQRSAGFDPERAYGWTKVLSKRESKLIRLLTRKSMRRFGYDPDARQHLQPVASRQSLE